MPVEPTTVIGAAKVIGAFVKFMREESGLQGPQLLAGLDALEDAFGLEPGTMVHARETLRLHGNMSAATILFVLERALKHEPPGRWLLSSLGPGFTAGFLLLEG